MAKIFVVPSWVHAGHTSRARGVRCAMFVGCRHAWKIAGWQIVDASQADEIVARWNAEAERLHAHYTAAWTDAQRATHRAGLGFPVAASS